MNEANLNLAVRRETGRAVPATLLAPVNGQDEREQSSSANIFEILLRRKWLMLGIFLAVAACGAAYTLLQPRIYSATALVMINPNPDQVVPEKQALSGARADAAMVDSQIEVLKSPAMAARLASNLNLAADPEWNPDLPKKSGWFSGVTGGQNPAPAAHQSQAAPINPSMTPGQKATAEALAVPDAVVDTVDQAINIRRRGLSWVIEVSANAGSGAEASQMANGLASAYLKSLAEARYDDADKANQWLKDRLAELRAEVEQKQAAVQTYRAKSNMLTTQGSSLVEQQVAQVQSALLATRAEYAQKQAEHTELLNIGEKGLTVASNNGQTDALRDLRAKQAEMAQRLADLQTRYGANHPTLQQAKEEKAAIDKQVQQEMQRVISRSKADADAVGARLRTQEAQLASLHEDLVGNNFSQVRLNALETDAEAARSVYESFLQRYHEVARQGNLAAVEARFLSPARIPPVPSSPHFLLNGALTVAAAGVLAVLFALLAEQFRKTIESTEEVEQRVGARALVAVPALRRRDMRRLPSRNRNPASYLLTKRMSPFTEAFRVLHASIVLSNRPQSKVVAVTSAMPGEGKTTLSLGLARVAAIGGQKVIIVDCDIRMRSLNKVLDIDPQEGIQQVLNGELSWKDAVGCDAGSGAHVLPAAGQSPSKDVFGSGAMESLIAELAEEYDLVVLDCAPIFAVAETRLIASLADTVVVAARAHHTSSRALAGALAQLELAGARVLGVALNRVDAKNGRRSFYDGLYYSKAFSGYYAREA
ncbi:MAG: AAA family ATPase [Alphaproteobacteria bacterium]|nr:AAA family ATPase [Alphaproteobacteria bacterium]